MNIKNLPFDERPREKLLTKGKNALSDAELLAVLLRTGTRELSALELAAKIIYGSEDGLRGLGMASPQELCHFDGIGKAKACELVAALELGRRLTQKESFTVRERITCAKNAADFCMEELRYSKKEIFKALLVDCKGHIISEEQISVGDMTSANVHPREVFSPAVRKSAYAMILIHNHPSGEPTPSREDKLLTERLAQVGRMLGIYVADHVVIGDGSYYSFKENNLL